MNSLFPEFYQGETINLDFHSIPHYGEKSKMEKNWAKLLKKLFPTIKLLFIIKKILKVQGELVLNSSPYNLHPASLTPLKNTLDL